MLLLASLFPMAKVLVAVATRKQAWKLWRKLEVKLAERVGLALSGVQRQGNRWLVGTYQSIPHEMAGKFDILLLPNGEEATGEKAVRVMVAEMQFKRRYALQFSCSVVLII